MSAEKAVVNDEAQFDGSFGLDNFYPLEQARGDIVTLGSSAPLNKGGVPLEQAEAFGFQLASPLTEANLGEFIGVLGKSKFFQENEAGVRERLGDGEAAAHTAREWAMRLHMGRPVLRSFMSSEQSVEQGHTAVAITSAVPNWMWGRAQELRRLADEGLIDRTQPVILAAGNGKATGKNPADAEGEELLPDDATQSEFMKWVVLPALRKDGFTNAEVLPVRSDKGRDVALALVEKVASQTALAGVRILLVSNPSGWVENADQVRRMARERHRGFDSRGDQLDVASYGIQIGKTGDAKVEDPRKFQNPWTAMGAAGRAYRALTLHTADS